MAQGRAFKDEQMDFSGGWSEAPPAHLDATQSSLLRNFYALGKKLRRRKGYVQVSDSAGGVEGEFTSLCQGRLSDGTWVLLVGRSKAVAKLVGSTVVDLLNTEAPAYNSLPLVPWSIVQYGDEFYAARRDTGTLKRVTTELIGAAGIAAPTVAGTIVDGGAGGVMAAGDYYLSYTFYNRNSGGGAESNQSPLSGKVTIAADHKIAASGIGVSGDPQVTGRRVYLTQPGGATPLRVATIDNNWQTTLTINVAQAAFGVAAPTKNGLPPPGIKSVVVFFDRLFGEDGKNVVWSELGQPQGYDANSVIPIAADAGSDVAGLFAWGDRLVVPTATAIPALAGSGPSRFEKEWISREVGCASIQSMVQAGTSLIWFAPDRNFYISDGIGARSISRGRLDATLAAIGDENLGYVSATVVPSLSLYVVTLGTGTVAAYDYTHDAWFGPWEFGALNPLFVKLIVKADETEALYTVDRNVPVVHEMLTGSLDNGQPVTALWRSGGRNDPSGLAKGVRKASVLSPPLAGQSLTLRVFNNESGSMLKQRTVPIDRQGWKRAGLNTVGKQPAAIYQIEAEYSGEPELEIEGVVVEGNLFPRRDRSL